MLATSAREGIEQRAIVGRHHRFTIQKTKDGDLSITAPPSLASLTSFGGQALVFVRQTSLFPEIPRPRRQRIFRLHEVLHVPFQLELVVARLRQRRRRRDRK